MIVGNHLNSREATMDDARETAQQMMQGMLGKELYVILTTPVRPREELEPMLPDHLAHQISLEKRGIMFGAGPMFEKDAKAPGRGMVIIRAGSYEEADEIAAVDPFHKAGLRTYTIERWVMNEGSYTVTVNYSDQSVTIA